MICVMNINERVEWIKDILRSSGAKGIIYGNSGGKDCTLVGALCKMATDNVLGVIMPCGSSRNYGSDREDALKAGEKFAIEQIEVDLTDVKGSIMSAMGTNFVPESDAAKIAENSTGNVNENAAENDLKDKATVNTKGAITNSEAASANINPRLRMTVLYAIGQARGYLVAGTGNLCESTMGYFTKWGDGAYDFNPIADMKVSEIYAMLDELGAPANIISKAPSAGLYEGQTDEGEMGLTYAEIEDYLDGKEVDDSVRTKIENAKKRNAHKLRMPLKFGEKA